MATRKLPWVIISKDANETARFLIQHAGGVQAAHDAVTRAAKRQKRKQGKPPIVDTHWLLMADAIQRDAHCSDQRALRQVADLNCAEDFVAKMVRRLRRKLDGKSLAKFAEGQPLRAVRLPSGKFDFVVPVGQ